MISLILTSLFMVNVELCLAFALNLVTAMRSLCPPSMRRRTSSPSPPRADAWSSQNGVMLWEADPPADPKTKAFLGRGRFNAIYV